MPDRKFWLSANGLGGRCGAKCYVSRAADTSGALRHNFHLDRSLLTRRHRTEIPRHLTVRGGFGLRYRFYQACALRNKIMDLHIVGGTTASILYDQFKGRFAIDLHFSRSDFLNGQRWDLNALEFLFAWCRASDVGTAPYGG